MAKGPRRDRTKEQFPSLHGSAMQRTARTAPPCLSVMLKRSKGNKAAAANAGPAAGRSREDCALRGRAQQRDERAKAPVWKPGIIRTINRITW
jgi:hypothetical protein